MHTNLITENYELYAVVSAQNAAPQADIFFSGNDEIGAHAYLSVSDTGFKIIREAGDTSAMWKSFSGAGPPPWHIHILKKGNFFRVRVNDATGWMRGPLGEWEGIYEPRENEIGVRFSDGCAVESCSITTLPWLQQITAPVITTGSAGSFYEKQIIPGAIIPFEGRYYMYCMAGMEGVQEGSSRRTITVATSDDLLSWTVHPEPILSCDQLPGDNIYVNGAVVTPEGRIAVMISAQQYPEWLGFMLATADNPLGPFTSHTDNPVYKHFNEFAHEFDLVRVDHPDHRYMLFYAGFTPEPADGSPAGDRGYLLYSDDMMSWRADERNPVFSPETIDNWDAIHVRPRSLNRIGDMWYLWYEGCNTWTPPGVSDDRWCDTVGLARSPDLVTWTYYPRNPVLPASGISEDQFDNGWTGWPRMIINDGVGYVFYTGNAQVGLRTISIEALTRWETEGGDTVTLAT